MHSRVFLEDIEDGSDPIGAGCRKGVYLCAFCACRRSRLEIELGH